MYHAPSDLTDALSIARDFGGKIVAGGTDFFPSTKQGQLPTDILDITGISDLKTITQGAEGTRIGAAVTWSQIVRHPLSPAFDALKQAACEVGSIQIQNAGTIAGNICNASPAADGVPPLMAMDATVEVASLARGHRHIPLSAFLLGVRQTALAPDELVTAITIPPLPDTMGSAFEKLGSRTYLVISITMTAAMIACDRQGKISQARICVGACAPVAQRLSALEKSLIGQNPSKPVVTPAHLAELAPIDDVRGSKEFRLDVVAAQCKRAIRRAARHG